MKLDNVTNTSLSMPLDPNNLATLDFSDILGNFSVVGPPDAPPWFGGGQASTLFDRLDQLVQQMAFLLKADPSFAKPLDISDLSKDSKSSVFDRLANMFYHDSSQTSLVYMMRRHRRSPSSAGAAAAADTNALQVPGGGSRVPSGVYGFERPPSVYAGFADDGRPVSVYGFPTDAGFATLVEDSGCTSEELREFEAALAHKQLLNERASVIAQMLSADIQDAGGEQINAVELLAFSAAFEKSIQEGEKLPEMTLQELGKTLLYSGSTEKLIGLWAALRTIGISAENLQKLRKAALNGAKSGTVGTFQYFLDFAKRLKTAEKLKLVTL